MTSSTSMTSAPMAVAARVIAIDGPAAAGKGTLARRLAHELGFRHLDTGMIYRAAASLLLAAGGDPDDGAAAERAARAMRIEDLGRADLRHETVGQAASRIAALEPVRAALLDFQRAFGRMQPGAVLDGRDIGTVVFPDARAKLFVTASPEARAHRRQEELRARGLASIFADVLEEMRQRDRRDRERAVAPLRPASDALLLDTTDMSADEVFTAALAHVNARL